MKDEIIIFSDGASKGNPGPGGWGAVVAFTQTVVELGGGEAHTTNNRMELTGAIKALELVRASVHSAQSVMLYTDSRYVINGITQWISGWKQRGWKTLQKEDVVNRDLWEQLDAVVGRLTSIDVRIVWHYVGGHIGIVGNERVDEIASSFAENNIPALFSGDKTKYTYNISDISFNAVEKKEKSNSKNRSRAKAYSYISMVDGVVERHATWEECERRVKGVSKTKFKKALSAQDERDIIADWKK